ncbi:hypothetical protein AgCh_008197 [Apium graveolens]
MSLKEATPTPPNNNEGSIPSGSSVIATNYRAPLSDITNKSSHGVFRGTHVSGNRMSTNQTTTSTNLRSPLSDISNKFIQGMDDGTDFDSSENSIIADFQAEEGELFWDDDCHSDEKDDINFEKNLENSEKLNKPVPKGYSTLGPPTETCFKCGAVMWKEERSNKDVTKGTPKFSLCCSQGQIKLPPIPATRTYLIHLYSHRRKSFNFKRNIRLYNAIFAFTSMGGKVDHSINCGRAPYVYRLNGQNHHIFGLLIPDEGDDPKFCQLYIYDTEHEVDNRMKWVKVDDGEPIDAEIVEGLVHILDESNQLVKKFCYARDRFKEQPVRDLKIKLKICRAENGRKNLIGLSDEVACVMVGEIDTTVGDKDIIVEKKINDDLKDIIMQKCDKPLEHISSIHPSLMALQYPLLFPLGEDGLHVRLAGRLYQQYVVDTFSCFEQARLWWLRTHQTNLRSDLYKSIAKKVVSGTTDTFNVGKGFVLPANFLG